jgi:hypothetical protein
VIASPDLAHIHALRDTSSVSSIGFLADRLGDVTEQVRRRRLRILRRRKCHDA